MAKRSYKLQRQLKSISTQIDYERLLNVEQFAAVKYCDGPQLIAAGAGTGKTRTMVYKVAWLVEHGIDPSKIVLLTFTRRASQEMKDRASTVLDNRCQAVLGGTFHSFANQVLRKYAPQIGFNKSFSIIDSSEAADVFQHLRTEAKLHTKDRRFAKKSTLNNVHSKMINTGLLIEEILTQEYPQYIDDAHDFEDIFKRYKEYKKHHHLMDYDDLLTHLRDILYIDSVRKEVTQNIEYLIVDEYQDTNKVQSEISCLLSSRNMKISVVGDDFQSIYSFRGASHQNMLDFPKILPSTQVFYLQNNYRSTQNILDLSNSLMQNVELAYPKKLVSTSTGNDKPAIVPIQDVEIQASFVTQRVLELREEGIPLDKIAVLFRSGFHSNELEVHLSEANIPFMKFGGIKFTEAAHVKDLITFLKIAQNPKDMLSWQRLLLLLEGVGPGSAVKVFSHVDSAQDLWEINLEAFSKKKFFIELNRLIQVIQEIAPILHDPQACIEKALSFYEKILKKTYENYTKRLKDLESLVQLASRFDSVEKLLSELSLDPPLIADEEEDEEDLDQEKLTLSTIHSAKGLEFHSVFILSVVEGSIPSAWAQKEAAIEEERRLLYVALTRPEKNLYIMQPEEFASSKSYMGGMEFSEPSRFIDNIPHLDELVEVWQIEEDGIEEEMIEGDSFGGVDSIKDFFS